MNNIIASYAEYTEWIKHLVEVIRNRRNIFPEEKDMELLLKLSNISARYKAIVEIATFIDKQQRKIAGDLSNLERKLKRDEKLIETDELRGLRRQQDTLWEFNVKHSQEIEYLTQLNHLYDTKEEIQQALIEVQEELIAIMETANEEIEDQLLELIDNQEQ